MKKQRVMVLLAFSSLLLIATIIGCGTAVVDGFLIPVGGEQAKFAFVVNSHPDSNVAGVTISAYTVNPSTGALTAVPTSPFNTKASGGGGTLFIDVDPTSRFLYVPNRGADSVSVFSIAASGALTEISGSPFNTAGSDAFAVKLHANSQFLYVANRSSDDITVFSIGPSGALTPVETPISTDGDPHHLFMDPKGRFLYVSIWGEGYAIDGYAIHQDGSLTYIPGAFQTASLKRPQSGMVDSTGKFLLVANYYGDNVTVFSIDQTTGDLTEVTAQGSPFAAGNGPFHVVEFAAAGVTYMAVNNQNDGTISVYSFDSTTGKLTPVGSPVDTLGLSVPHYMAVDPSGKFGYIVDQNNDNIVGITLNAAGQATTIPNSPFSGGGISAPSQIVISH